MTYRHRLVVCLFSLALVLLLPRASAASDPYPNDPLFSGQWYLHNSGQDGGKPGADIHVLDAWRITHCSPDIIIADIDTGADRQHPDLASNLIGGTAFGTGDTSTADDFGHGTATAGVVAAAGDNGIGITGVCPLGKVMPIRIGHIADGNYDRTNSPHVAQAIHWAVDHGARVISMSIGVWDSPALRAATAYAYRHGVVQVAATGNTGGALTYSPVDDPHVLAVGGSDNQDRRWRASSYGPNHDLVLAPAEGILTTLQGGGYGQLSGTSFSTPQVAGLAALLLSVRPNLSVDQVILAIEQGADPVQGQREYDREDGYGRINCFHSVQIARNLPVASSTQAPPAAATPTPTLGVALTLATHLLLPHRTETLRVHSTQVAEVLGQVVYKDGTSMLFDGRVPESGWYRRSWRVPAIHGRARIDLQIATDDGRVAWARGFFHIR